MRSKGRSRVMGKFWSLELRSLKDITANSFQKDFETLETKDSRNISSQCLELKCARKIIKVAEITDYKFILLYVWILNPNAILFVQMTTVHYLTSPYLLYCRRISLIMRTWQGWNRSDNFKEVRTEHISPKHWEQGKNVYSHYYKS